MVGEPVVGLARAERLAEGVLVHDVVWSSLKNARSDPWFQDKPSAKVNTANLLAAEVELEIIGTLEVVAARDVRYMSKGSTVLATYSPAGAALVVSGNQAKAARAEVSSVRDSMFANAVALWR